MSNNPELSIIVLSYNTKDLLKACLGSLDNVANELDFEVIVPDNGSTDGSAEMVKSDFPKVKLVKNKENLGFAAGNNTAKDLCRGKHILFLNSDTIVYRGTLAKTLFFLKKNKKIGAITCKIELPNGELDKDTRRAFITPWIGLTHIFLKLDRLFPKSYLFAKYWYGYLPEGRTHEVDAIQGAFFMTSKEILDDLGWFDEDYFLDGEDIDLCWRIKKAGFKIVYYPEVSILHLKGASKGKDSKRDKQIPLSKKLKFRLSGVNSMEIFYRKRLWSEYPLVLNYFVLTGINLLKATRFIKTIILG